MSPVDKLVHMAKMTRTVVRYINRLQDTWCSVIKAFKKVIVEFPRGQAMGCGKIQK